MTSTSDTSVQRASDHSDESRALDPVWVRIGGTAGIFACLLLFAAGFVTNNTLSSNSSTTQIINFLTSHRSGVLTQTLLTVTGGAISLWFAATLARLIHTRDQHSPLGMIVLVAGAAMTVIASLDGITLTALEFLSKQGGLTDRSITRVFYDLENGIIMPGMFGCAAAIFLTALGIAMVRGKFGARWIGWISLLFAALSVVSAIMGLTVTNGGTSAIGYFPAIGFVLVGLTSSIYIVRYRLPLEQH